MNSYIGVDLGTSGAKFLLVAADGRILSQHTESYPVSYPASGWSEQDPHLWEEAAFAGIARLLEGQNAAAVRGIGVGGQMHGLVLLDARGEVIRPAILWNDGRTQAQTDALNARGLSYLAERVGNAAFAGFTAPKILWVRENEPENFSRIEKILLPKDYVVHALCGAFSTDYSDASGTLLLDVRRRRWSKELCDVCGVKEEWLPELFESFAPVGTLLPAAAERLGLSPDVVVCAGAGDNAAAAVGTGTVREGDCNISLGTSGTVFVPQDAFSSERCDALHSFCHANGKFHRMGCILSAASCNAWWSDSVLKSSDYAREQAGAEKYMGKNDVFFLPYLMGERSPHNDVHARGAFLGMRPDTSREQMTLAVLEGVAFALRDCVEIAGGDIRKTTLCGGGAKSPLWRKVIANVLGIPVARPVTEEGPAYGGAMLAMVACGEFSSVEEAADALTGVRSVEQPDPVLVRAYDDRYAIFVRLYPALKETFRLF